MKSLAMFGIIMGLLSFLNLNAAEENLLHIDLTVKEVKGMMKDPTREMILLDVRTLSEYKSARIKGAILIPVQELEERISEISQYKNIEKVVYCRVGNRSVTASQILNKHGHVSVFNMLGGINKWISVGFPVDK